MRYKIENKFFLLIVFFSFFFTEAFANNSYFKCLEKITKVKSGDNLEYFEGNEHGHSFIKLDFYSNNPTVTIHFKSINSKDKPNQILKDIDTVSTTLGFDLDYISSNENSSSEIKYSFIKIKNTYAITKKKFLWLTNKNTSNEKDEHDYESSSRCISIDELVYLDLIESDYKLIKKSITYDWSAIIKHPKSDKHFIATELSTKQKAINLAIKKCYKFVTRELNKVGYNNCIIHKVSNQNILDDSKTTQKEEKKFKNNDSLKGSRMIALSWVGLDDLIIGKLFFDEKNLIGSLNFNLPTDNTKCIGTYVLSTTKGTWSILCEKNNINASGILKWNNQNGSISGSGRDEKGNLVKFKVAGKN